MIRGQSYYVEPGSPINPNGDLFPSVTPGIAAAAQAAVNGSLAGAINGAGSSYVPVTGSGAGVDAGFVQENLLILPGDSMINIWR